MTDATTPTTPSSQDLQINLEEAPKSEEVAAPEDKPVELDLNLDLNLPEVPKNDDRLKNEDQKNNEDDILRSKNCYRSEFPLKLKLEI